jgi:hypothetical protein
MTRSTGAEGTIVYTWCDSLEHDHYDRQQGYAGAHASPLCVLCPADWAFSFIFICSSSFLILLLVALLPVTTCFIWFLWCRLGRAKLVSGGTLAQGGVELGWYKQSNHCCMHFSSYASSGKQVNVRQDE